MDARLRPHTRPMQATRQAKLNRVGCSVMEAGQVPHGLAGFFLRYGSAHHSRSGNPTTTGSGVSKRNTFQSGNRGDSQVRTSFARRDAPHSVGAIPAQRGDRTSSASLRAPLCFAATPATRSAPASSGRSGAARLAREAASPASLARPARNAPQLHREFSAAGPTHLPCCRTP